MNECCEETFRLALEQVLMSIKDNKPATIYELVQVLEYCIDFLKKSKKKPR